MTLELEHYEITLVVPKADALALVRGEVPHDVLVAVLSGIISLHEEPAEFVSKPKRRRKVAA